MKSSSKVILVLAGYLLALVIAWVVVTMYVAATSGPDRQTYGAMFDFGDTILFLGVFGLASLPATGAALFFLRPYQVFWRVLAAGAVAIAVTGIIVLVDMLVSRNSTAGALLGQWSMVSPIRFFLAPVLAMIFFACGWFAPDPLHSHRISLRHRCGDRRFRMGCAHLVSPLSAAGAVMSDQ